MTRQPRRESHGIPELFCLPGDGMDLAIDQRQDDETRPVPKGDQNGGGNRPLPSFYFWGALLQAFDDL
ncbi:MAG TPA: hypothetical protein VGK45_10600, partial [Thermoanaerobaculia bacterium]